MAMDDDFNTSQATAVIFDFVKEVNKVISENDNLSKKFYEEVKNYLQSTAENILGIVNFASLQKEPENTIENELINLLIEVRLEAKKKKDFMLADKIRDELKTLGVLLEDKKDKTTFKRV